MNILRHFLTTLLFASSAALAQGFESNFGTSLGGGDDVLKPAQALGFSFPFAGSTYSDIHISTNGFLYLSSAGVPAPGGANGTGGGGYGSAASQLTTLLSGPPKIMAFHRDLNLTTANSGAIYVNTITPGRCVVTWVNAVDYPNIGATKTFQCQLFASGQVSMCHRSGVAVFGSAPATVGLSPGGGAADPGALDLSSAPLSTAATAYEQFGNTGFDLYGCFDAVPVSWLPFLQWQFFVSLVEPANHSTYCSGYGVSDSFYQYMPDAGAASAVLSGNGLSLTRMSCGPCSACGYHARWYSGGASLYVPPPLTASVLPASDDSMHQIDLTANGIPDFADGCQTWTSLFVHDNGWIGVGANSNSYVPTPATFLDAPAMAFWSWHDFNPAEPGSGRIKWWYAAPSLYVTWEGVENYATPEFANPSTVQFIINPVMGSVLIVWPSIDADASSPWGSAHLVGWSPGGPSHDDGSMDMPQALSWNKCGANLPALSLTATGDPISPVSTVTYTVNNIPEFVPASGIHVGVLALSLTKPAVPIHLPSINVWAPDNFLCVGLDYLEFVVGVGGPCGLGTATISRPYNGIPINLDVYAQFFALFAPGSLPNGENNALNGTGMSTSNAIRSHFYLW